MKALVAVAVCAAACIGLEPLSETTTEQLDVASVDLPGELWDPLRPPLEEGEPVTLTGTLTIPPTDKPVPAVIISHGCGGPSGAERGWIDDLADAGFAVLLLDSFGGRDISIVCFGSETINVSSIVVDVYRAAQTLAEHPYIDESRIAVMGFSFGGRAAIWSAMDSFRDAYEGFDFRAHIAFYPSTCYIELADEASVTSTPIRIFHGTADNWTPIDQCQDYVGRMAGAGRDVALYAYEDAHHSFDDETTFIGLSPLDAPSPRNCRFVEIEGRVIDPETGEVAGVGSPCVESGVLYGYNAAAHRQSKADLLSFLEEVFAPSD